MTTHTHPDAPDNDGSNPSMPPSMPFWQMLPGPDGRSTIGQAWLDGFVQRSVSGKAAPSWMRAFEGSVKTIWFNVLPAGWIGELHPSPALQWVVPLSGHWFIETQDGTRVEMGPGDIHWGADVDEGSAHLSGVLGDAPCVQMMIQFETVDDAGVAVARQAA